MARILIAEDNKDTAVYVKALLKKAGYRQIEVVDNSLDAWRATTHGEFDVLMIDVLLPGIDGFILAQKALQDNPAMQIVFITGFAGVAMDTFNTPNYAPQPYTSAPFHLNEIVSRIRFLLGEADLPAGASMPRTTTANDASLDNVVYADFGTKRINTGY